MSIYSHLLLLFPFFVIFKRSKTKDPHSMNEDLRLVDSGTLTFCF